METTIEKNEYAEHLEKILEKNGIELEITSKEDLIEGLNHYYDLKIQAFYEYDDFDSSGFNEYRNNEEKIVKNYIKQGNNVFLSGRNEVLFTKSAKEPGKYQITYFDKKGPISDSIQDTLDDSIQYLMKNDIVPINKNHVEYLSPQGVANMTQKNNDPKLVVQRMLAQQMAMGR